MSTTTKPSFFARLKSFFVKFFTDAPAWEKVASGAIGLIAPLVETALSLAGDSPAAAVVTSIVGKIQTDLATASIVIEDSGPAPTVASILGSIKTNLTAILEEVKVTDPASVDKITAGVTLLTGEIDAILAEIPALAAPAAPAPAAA